MNKQKQQVPKHPNFKNAKGKKKGKKRKMFTGNAFKNQSNLNKPVVSKIIGGNNAQKGVKPYQPADLAPFPPKIADTEDFTKDCVDLVDDTASKTMNPTIFTINKTTASVASVSTKTFTGGAKIPVRMRSITTKLPVSTNVFKTNKDDGTSANQKLKDCLSSDIVTVVKDNIKANESNTTTQFQQQLNKQQSHQLQQQQSHQPQLQQQSHQLQQQPSHQLQQQLSHQLQQQQQSHQLQQQQSHQLQQQQSHQLQQQQSHQLQQQQQSHQLQQQLSHQLQQQQSHPPFSPMVHPTGVPRSFLTRSNQIEPQDPVTYQQRFSYYIPSMQSNHPITHSGLPQPTFAPTFAPTLAPPLQNNPPVGSNMQTFAQKGNSPARYSPTDLYDDLDGEQQKDDELDNREGSLSPDWQDRMGEKRVSAFDRLGPIAETKKPKLTINLSFDKEQAVREVVEETKPPKKVYVPVHEREDILSSTDETVMKYVALWPWTKNLMTRRSTKSKVKFPLFAGSETSAAVGHSKTAMLMVKEQMDEIYQRDNAFVGVTVTGYPSSWTKEDVLDVMLENLKGKTFIPCFIEFDDESCKFIVIRCRQALLAIHDLEFTMRSAGVQLYITISQLVLSVVQLDFIPRLVLRKRLAMLYEGTRLDLGGFTLQPDVSHFIYYPLSHLTNQLELMELQTDVIWLNLTELDLSRNRLTTIEGFDISKRMPRLKSLNLSHNRLERASLLLCCRRLPLRSLWLEGNPLCHDYIEAEHYVNVMKMMFPMLTLLDGMPIKLKGDMPHPKPSYCPHNSVDIVDKFLQIYIPLIDSNTDDRVALQNLYADDALLTVTYRPKFGLDPELRYSRSLFIKSRVILEGNLDYSCGRADIEKLLRRWPNFEHDPSTFTIDVFFHTETSTIFRLNGAVKLLADSLAENDQLVAFSKTIHLQTTNQVEYKIKNEMIYWDEPTEEYANAAFKRTAVQRKPLSFKFELPPDDESKKRLVGTFMKITRLEEKLSKRCLELKDWDLRDALEYFMKLYKVDNLVPLMKTAEDDKKQAEF